jgi:signal peptidase
MPGTRGQRLRRLWRIGSAVAIAAAGALALLVLAPAAIGLQRYVIVSGSMAGSYDRGSLVLADVVPVRDLRVGDVITYRPPATSGVDHLVTHRIAEAGSDHTGVRVFRTKGDANPVADPWEFSLTRDHQARVVAGIPYAGYALAALSDRDLRMAVIGVPALLIALVSLLGTWRVLGELARRPAEAESA